MTTRIIRGKDAPAKAKKVDPSRKTAAKVSSNGSSEVDAQLAKVRYPLKTEVQTLRAIIKGVHPGITEQWKWNAPSFSYKDYMVTFNLRDTKQVRLIFHNGAILNDQGGLLQGDYVDRRIASFSSMADVRAKKPALVGAIQEWIAVMDQ